MAYKDAFLTNAAVVFMGANIERDSSPTNEAAPEVTINAKTLEDLYTAFGITVDTAPTGGDGWIDISTDGWGFVFGSYPGPTVELAEQGCSTKSTFRQSLGVQDMEWSFQVDENVVTKEVLLGLNQKPRRFYVFPNGIAGSRPYDNFVSLVTATTQDNGGRKQYNVTTYLNSRVQSGTLPA